MIKSRKERRQEWKESKKNYTTKEEWYQAWDKEFAVKYDKKVSVFTYGWHKEKMKDKEYQKKCEQRRKERGVVNE